MNMKIAPKKMRGLMCHSPAATAVCMSMDQRSVIMPKQQEKRASARMAESILVSSNAKYSKLVESPHFILPKATSPSLPSSGREQQAKLKPLLLKKSASTPLPPPDQVFQVVVMRVSLHCQGCASKIKRHLSKMEGVTSFSIDLEDKRVTVMGHVSPVGVVESISKVKRAELWPC